MIRDKAEEEADFADRRLRMVEEQIFARGVRDAAVLAAMRTVPRHLFVPKDQRRDAYEDGPLSIGHEQTISQPYVVASMTEHLDLDGSSRVLEIGTGSGYQSAVLAEIAGVVFTVEIIPALYENVVRLLNKLGYHNVKVKLGDGSIGWTDEAPFDRIIVTAAAPSLPEQLLNQLAPGGKLVIPLTTSNPYYQNLYLIRKTPGGIEKEYLYGVRFVPMRGAIDL